MGDFFFAEMYIIPKAKSNQQTDTLLEMFSCDAIILDVFGAKQILIKNAKKYGIGEIENKEYLEIIEPIFDPLNKFERSIENQLAYKSYEIKKIKKFNSRYLIDDNSKSLKFAKDFTTILDVKGKNEYQLSWNKKDSLFNKLSRYFEMGSNNSDNASIIVPFASTELSNINTEYINTSVLHEMEMKFIFGEERLMFTNSNFGYFYIHKKVSDDVDQDGYKEIESFETLYQNTKVNKSAGELIPIIYPLRFPSAIFFD